MNFEVRSIGSIFEQLLVEKTTFDSLLGLTDQGITDLDTLLTAMDESSAADWILFTYSDAVGGHLLELSLKTGIDDIQSIIDNQRIYSYGWWKQTILDFQYGDLLTFPENSGVPQYEVIDVSKQIIGSVTLKTIPGRLIFKVRKKDNTVLTTDERNLLNAYIASMGKGLGFELISYASDKFKITGDIIYSAYYPLSTVRTAVETAITSYLNDLGEDGTFLTNKLVDKIQSVEGVIDPRITNIEVLDPLAATITVDYEYLTASGWGEINTSYPLTSTLNYIVR